MTGTRAADPVRPNRGLRYLVSASAISNLGDGLHLVAFPLLGATLTRDPLIISALAGVGLVPHLLLALVAGGLVDRLDRGRLMVVADVVRAALLLLLLVALTSGSLRIWHLFVLAASLGVCELLFDLASPAYLPSIVERGDLVRANSLLATVAEFGNGVLGPAIGGLVFAVAAGLPFLVNCLSFLVSAALVARIAWRPRIAHSETPATATPIPPKRSFAGDIADGIRWIAAHRALRPLAALIFAWNLLGWLPEGPFVLYATQELHLGSLGFGLLFAATSVGAVIGGLLCNRIVAAIGTVGVLHLAVVTYALLTVPPAFLHSPIAVGIVLFVQGVPLIAWSVVSATIQQILVPHELRGRVGSVFALVGAGIAPLGLFLGGVLGQWLGLRAVFVVSGVTLLIAYVVCLPGLRRLATAVRDKLD